MLILKMNAQTGNNMFQYAACKTLADDKGYRFSFRGGKKGSLFEDFELSGETKWSLRLQHIIYELTPGSRRRLFRFEQTPFSPTKVHELIDPAFFEIEDGYTVQGTFQSEEYFKHNRENILKWYTPRKKFLQRVEQIEAEISTPKEKRCCIHVRRSDYQDMVEKKDGLGWILPIAYYQEALKSLPDDLKFIIISDDPDFASEVFKELPNTYVSRDNPAVVDMFLLTRCRYNILANSTFSWWGGWLNDIEDKVIIAPKYNLGWPDSKWFPYKIKVDEWQYINVNDALQKHNMLESIKIKRL